MAPAALSSWALVRRSDGRRSSKSSLLVTGILVLATACARGGPQRGVLKAAETGLRSLAIDHPQPDYPASSITRGSAGVAVAAIRVGTGGDVERVNVLEAPDPEISACLRRTLLRWRFVPARVDGSPEPRAVEGKLTFYFQIRDGRPTVDEPQSSAQGAGNPRRQGWVLDAGPTSTVNDDALVSLLRTGDAVLVNVAGRDALANGARASIHIPFDELSVRAPQELPRGKTIVLECVVDGVNRCAAFAAALHSVGFTDVRVWRPQSSSPISTGARR
jgi:TonB family protein